MKKTNIIVFIVFITLALIVGMKHEPWTDEAQSWLIARDASVVEIVWDIARYEGTFPLWFLTLKFFMAFGLDYEHLYIVPIIISAIGLIVFLKKVEAPKYVKVLLPFTYYVFYQYTIIARSYCYLFLGLSLLCITYKKRKEEPLKYTLSLIFLSFISMHGMVFACGLGLMFLIEVIREKSIKKYLKEAILFGVVIILEGIILCPRSDLYMTVSAVSSFYQVLKCIFESIIGNGNIFFKLYNAIAIILLLILFIGTCFTKNKDIPIATGIVIFFMFLIRFASHHSGILFLIMIFGILICYDEMKEKSKLFEKVFKITLILYVIFSLQSGVNDFFLQYSSSKEMANYIEANGYDEKEIFGFGYKTVSLEPYFEENVYKNWDESIYRWSINNKDFYTFCNIKDIDISDFTEVPEYIVIECNDTNLKLHIAKEIIEGTGKYEIEYQTMGYQFFKNSYAETEGYTLYRLK